MKFYSIAIDGPAGSGKSTIAKSVAKGLEFIYIDTGAMYRAITLKALELNIRNLADETLYDFILDTKLEFVNDLMFMDGKDVSKEIRSEEVVKNVSLVSSLKYVRDILVEKQREMAKTNNVVMDGRDIGTNVLKDASLKIFLTAAIDVRALRRFYELQESGSSMSYDDVVADVMRRDNFDTNRLNNPLRQAEDAILIDNSELTIEETAQKIMHLFKEKNLWQI
ncbi:MAG: (d)CMP kinase [Gammaproteobacteria bacterium]|nr:(d)CMP kinase [Gammaproteobacteria bacterium]